MFVLVFVDFFSLSVSPIFVLCELHWVFFNLIQ